MKYLSIILIFLAFSIINADENEESKVGATHLHHMHMPNFWPFYDENDASNRIQYKLDGDIILLQDAGKKLPFVPHDNLRTYYAHDAKQHGYTDRPPRKIGENNSYWPRAGAQVTFSGALMTNIQNLADHRIHFWQDWARDYRNVYYNTKTKNGFRALDFVYFTYHHSMGPLVGPEYFEKELLMHEHISKSPFFMGENYEASKGFFPTELGFSERLIPTLRKLGIEWSFVSNTHLSRTLRDYPNMNLEYTNNLISPPNRAYMINESPNGKWFNEPIFNQNREVVNKYPFSALPHYAKYVNPHTGQEDKIIVIPANQAASWQEGFMMVGPELADNVVNSSHLSDRKSYFVTAKDGDNSSGYGSGQDGYDNSTRIYSGSRIDPMTVNEYLLENPVPENDIVSVEDGSWIDTGDSPGDQNWYHWQLPPGRWQHPQKKGSEPFTVDMETGYHFQMRFYALLQAYLNYAITAEQMQTDLTGSPLRVDQMTQPLKGVANSAELGWYFLTSSLDSGFAYYGENVDDTMKPIVGMENSLRVTKNFVEQNLENDKTGPTMWWIQRWPTNPGDLNRDKSTGWVKRKFNNHFSIFTYAYDVSEIESLKVKVRVDNDGFNPIHDNTNEVYEPQNLQNTQSNAVGEWVEYEMTRRDLPANGMPRDKEYNERFYLPYPASITANLYYCYLTEYENCLVDYYVEAVDKKGNVKKSEIQHVWIGDKTGIKPFITAEEPLIVKTASVSPKSGNSGEKFTFKAEVHLNQNSEGHAHTEPLRIYFENATKQSHVAHWWFREISNGTAIKPTADYKNPLFEHVDGADGSSIDTTMRFDSDTNKYYIEIGPFTAEQKPKYVGHMIGAPLWLEESETQIDYSQQNPQVVAEIDFTQMGGKKEAMRLIKTEGSKYYFELSKVITNAGNYNLNVSAHLVDTSVKTRIPYKLEVEIIGNK